MHVISLVKLCLSIIETLLKIRPHFISNQCKIPGKSKGFTNFFFLAAVYDDINGQLTNKCPPADRPIIDKQSKTLTRNTRYNTSRTSRTRDKQSHTKAEQQQGTKPRWHNTRTSEDRCKDVNRVELYQLFGQIQEYQKNFFVKLPVATKTCLKTNCL